MSHIASLSSTPIDVAPIRLYVLATHRMLDRPMRVQGTLKKWNDARGFGFISLPQSHDEIFVHISAFQRSGIRPCVGEALSFEIRTGPDGRKRAEDVLSPGAPVRERGRRSAGTGRKRGTARAWLAAVVPALAITAYLTNSSHPGVPAETGSMQLTTPQQQFRCDGRTHCSQMTSCAEAIYFLQHCPNTQLDGNNDGEPCEQQWCN